VSGVYEEIRSRSGRIVLSTVSRVLRQLEDDLIVARANRGIRLLQPDKLLENLAAGYKPPNVTSRFVGRSSLPLAEVGRKIAQYAQATDMRVVFTGAASVNRYAAMAREPILSVYVEGDANSAVRRMELRAEPTDRFPNVEVFQTGDDAVYFDRRSAPDGVFASPVQAWLEMTTGEKRQREVADQIKAALLRDVALSLQGGGDAE
jgi:hypothetical protein